MPRTSCRPNELPMARTVLFTIASVAVSRVRAGARGAGLGLGIGCDGGVDAFALSFS